ncbi:hypothetical protein SKAU_G00058380 [Synaphobranchus kaupii]|uniref:Uncharacterized protein n=1 Tax=Synaphobranchus kaupii TaxID=118154 RepID=A0A9Q1JA46_SYNKA|nr:hypothetical protein SKAU_G00058380 [Synaphobranchus kaupii]
MSGEKTNEKAGEERSREIALESEGRIGVDNEALVKERGAEEVVIPEDQVEEEPHTDDPQEGFYPAPGLPRYLLSYFNRASERLIGKDALKGGENEQALRSNGESRTVPSHLTWCTSRPPLSL